MQVRVNQFYTKCFKNMIVAIIPKLPFIDKQLTIDFYKKIGFNFDADYGE